MANYSIHSISLSKHWTPTLLAQETLAMMFYNQVNYLLRQNFFFHSGQNYDESTVKFDYKYPKFEAIYHTIKTFPLYSILPSQVSQNIVKGLLQEYQSFKGLLKVKAKGQLNHKVNLPRYKQHFQSKAYSPFQKANQMHLVLTFDKGNFRQQGRSITLTSAKMDNLAEDLLTAMKEKGFSYDKKKITFNIDKTFSQKSIQQIKLVANGNGFMAQVIAKEADPPSLKQTGHRLSLDLNVSVHAGLDTLGNAFLIKNSKSKDANALYNKEKAELQAKLDTETNEEQKLKYLKRIKNIATKRANRLRNERHKQAKQIITYALTHDIKDIVIGWNEGIKDGSNMGKRNNQNFVMLPLKELIKTIMNKGSKVGIHVFTINESYTSKIDHLANEPIKHQETYLGRREGRRFRSSLHYDYHADINGALGIHLKSLDCPEQRRNLCSVVVQSGLFNRPITLV
jgi:putative transposase